MAGRIEKTATIRIDTSRLLGSPLSESDFDDLRTLHTDPRVTATLTADGNPLGEEATRAFLTRALEHWRVHGFGLFGYRLRVQAEFVGYCGIKHTILEGADAIELAYAVRHEYWRKEFATEMARASIEFALQRGGLEDLVAFTLTNNTGSRRVMESCGFHYDRDITHVGLPHVLYRLRA